MAEEKVAEATTATAARRPERVPVKIRLHSDTKERCEYWAAKAELSANEYMAEAVEEKIARENGDYDLPTLEAKRLAQIQDEQRSLSDNVRNLESVVVAMAKSLTSLASGDNYLLDEESGELVEVEGGGV